MDVFELRGRLVEDYARYTRSFIKIADERTRARVICEPEAALLRKLSHTIERPCRTQRT